MPFPPKEWKNGKAGGTKINAAGLNDLEQRISDGFGAFPFYLVDDYDSVHEAVSNAAAEGGTVLLPKGDTDILGSVVLPSNVALEGSGVNESCLKPTGVQDFTLIRNSRATKTSGGLDSNLTIRNLTLDGGSTGTAEDGRLGYGIELYGVDGFVLEDICLRDIPLSALEISGDIAAIANGVRSGTEPLSTRNGFVRGVRIDGAGWQLAHLSEDDKKEPWGDAGFGLIIRAGARDIDVQGVITTDTFYGGFGVGQVSNVNSSAAFPNKAQVAHITASGIHVDQSSARATPGAPSIRVAFAYDVAIANWSARGNAGSQGFAVRQAGTTDNLGIRISNGWSEDNEFGFIQTGASEAVPSQKVSISNVHCVANRKDGFYFEDSYTTATSCQAWGNERHNWNFQSPEAGVLKAFRSTLIGCVGLDASDPEGASSECGLQLKDAAYVKVIGGDFGETRSGGARTQNYGIREVGVSDHNTIIGVDALENLSGQIVVLGTHTTVLGRDNGPALPFRSLLATQGLATTAAASGTKYFFVPSSQNQSAPVPGNTNAGVSILKLAAADLAVTGRATKLRLSAEVSAIGTSPGVTVTVALFALNLETGKYVPGAEVEGSKVELATSGKTNDFVPGQIDLSLPPDGRYVPIYTVSGTPAANFKVDAQVLARNV
jgi:hypothetical protein